MILVTGAGGFVGSHLVKDLVKRKKNVVCLVRNSPSFRGAKILRGDITDKPSLIKATRNVSAVVHLATAPASSNYEEMYRVNVIGARNLIEACVQNKVKRVIVASSVATFGKSDYGKTKSIADDLFRESCLDVTILKPDFIYGKGCKGFETIVSAIKKLPAIPVIGSGNNRRQPIHVDDVVKAISNCLENKKTIGKTYLLAGKDSMKFNDMLDSIMKAAGKRKVKVHIPVPVALAASYVLKGKMSLTKTAILGISQDRVLDVSPMMKELGVTPISFEEGLKKSL